MISYATISFVCTILLSWAFWMAWLFDEVVEGGAGIDSVVIKTSLVTH